MSRPGSQRERTSPGQVSYRTMRPGDEDGIVALVNAAFPSRWGDVEQWMDKHARQPGFRPDEVHLAESEGRIVGCLHTAVRRVRFGPGLTIQMSFDGDLAVHPDFRGTGVAEEIYRASSEAYYRRGVHLRGGFTSEALWLRFYRPRIGYVIGFDRTRAFVKLLSQAKLRERLLAALGEARSGDEDPTGAPGRRGEAPRIEIRVRGIEPLHLRLLDRGAVAVEASEASGRALVVEADQQILDVAGASPRDLSRLLGLLLSGRIRFRGLLRTGPRVAAWWLRRRRG